MKEVPHVSRRTIHAECSWRTFRFDEPSVYRTPAAPRLLYLRIRSRRSGMSPSARALGRAAGLSKDTWRESGGFLSDAHLLSEMFGEGPEDCSGALAGDWTDTMTLRAKSPDRIASHPATAGNLRAHARNLCDRSCLRCGGLLVADYSASLACDSAGTLVTLWRCVNCGNCLDRFILANRLLSPMPARRRARPPAGPPRTGRPPGAGTQHHSVNHS